MGFLRFFLQSIDFIALPIVALGYPICSSIRAIETGSKYHMKKLVTYWTIFSIISLFEHLFEELIEWVPLWPFVKLITVCWLVIPKFNGACYFYQKLIHPCLPVKLHDALTQFYGSCYVYQRLLYLCFSVNLQTVIDWFNTPMDDASLKSETFLAVAERYLEENGSDALEKLIANKSKGYSLNHHDEEIKTTGTSAEARMLTLNQTVPGVADPVWEDIKVLEHTAKHEAPENKQDKSVKENLTVEKKTTGMLVKEVIVPADADEIKLPGITSSEKVWTEWTCEVCRVSTTAECNSKMHLNGRKHKAKCDQLKICLQTAKSEGSSPITEKLNQLSQEKVKPAAATQSESSTNKEEPKQIKNVKENPIKIEKKATDVQIKETKIPAEAAETHLLGRIYAGKIDELKTHERTAKSEETLMTITKSNQLNLEQVKHAAATQSKQCTNGAAEGKQVKSVKENPIQIEKTSPDVQIKERALPADDHEFKLPETNSSKQVQTKWTCKICQVTTTSEFNLKSHIMGKKHKAMCEEIKLSKTNSSKNAQREWTCALCQVTTTSEHDLKCHLKGMRHWEKCEELKTLKKAVKAERNPPCTSNTPDKLKLKQTKNAGAAIHKSTLWCSICNVRCPGKIDMAAHLNGRMHLAKLQEIARNTSGMYGWD